MNFRSRKIDRKRFLGFQLCFSPLQNTSTIWKICFPWTQVGGESACPQQSGAREGAAFFRQDSCEALSLHSAFVSKSSKILYTYPFSLFFFLSGFHGNAGFSEKESRDALCTQAACIIFGVSWAVNMSRNVSMNRSWKARQRSRWKV